MLFFAIIFASMISLSQGMRESTVSQAELQKERPAELSNYEAFGDVGLPKSVEQKGFPTKDRFNEDLILIEQTSSTVRQGMAGNLVWDFEELSNIRDRELILVEVGADGTARLDGTSMNLSQLQAEINNRSRTNNVFVRLHIDPLAPVVVYENTRNQLWNESDAIHWQFTTKSINP